MEDEEEEESVGRDEEAEGGEGELWTWSCFRSSSFSSLELVSLKEGLDRCWAFGRIRS